ncbi:hypothetical protein GGX14DRAFT_604755 [Mycena pura]|uniref:DUF6534 domain-containing protein n=1 Tax=Mycena pura TaxID=153505 RepID=A0AAD6YGU6_9AGAR|nr:hypothetical protein GGX14DRAFT_604755 [Mycena pura]
MALVNMHDTYGSLLVGTFFAIFFQGILFVQAYVYYENFPNDSWYLKSLVAIVWSLDLADLVVICQSVYHYLVSNWGNPAALAVSTEPFDLHLVLVGAATILCQGFFLHRVYILSRRNWFLTGILSLGCLGTMAFAIWITVQTSRNKNVSVFATLGNERMAMFSIGAGVDLIIAMLLVYYLSRERTTFESTNLVLNKIIHYTVATGLATSLLAIAAVAANVIKPKSFVYLAIHYSLGRMYTNALLATLNLRRNLRSTIKKSANTWSGQTIPSVNAAPAFVGSQAVTVDDPLEKTKGSWATSRV